MGPLQNFILKLNEISSNDKIKYCSYTTSWTLKIDIQLLPHLFNSLNFQPKMYWSNIDDGTFLILDKIRSVESNKNRFEILRQEINKLRGSVLYNQSEINHFRLFGGFSFDTLDRRSDKAWNDFSDVYFFVPKYLLHYADEMFTLTINLDSLNPDNLTTELNTIRSLIQQKITELVKISLNDKSLVRVIDNQSDTSFKEWQKKISKIRQSINSKKVSKVVLANRRNLRLSKITNDGFLLENLHLNYPSAYTFLLCLKNDTKFIGATPELLVQKSGDEIKTVALAGSRPRGLHEMQDIQIGMELLQSVKDKEEHQYVVDQIIEKLRSINLKVGNSEGPSVHKLKNIQHLKTKISAQGNVGLINLIETMHPTAAVGGEPTEIAIQQIRNLETFDRGWYASPIGWIDLNEDGRFVVALRSGVINNKTAYIYAGAGIVANSDAEAEWNEIGIKFQPISKAIGARKNNS